MSRTAPLADPADRMAVEPAPLWTFDEMRAWCQRQNDSPMFAEMEHWYFVDTVSVPADPDRKSNQITHLEGVDATNARKLIRGRLDDFNGWDEQRMDKYRSWLRSRIRRGMTDERLGRINQPGLGL
ncbi:hypothetical protein HNO88_002976 [Novosphingobium chloroacetimidivorans]|uniref:Uncharacterized protein n=1 Tax=Novosphingobium chloroacetimidivorans TaxID=1428314 RepID=A0A7W7KB92_9SPHN|nr:hypothetical protein [Novosphingobium chloroacetimidivorans]MBB4859647.1 hypothetical protein [Novosphingobium chloroacetimidivorans]